RASVGAASVGMGRRALNEALAHVQQRVQFGKALSTQQQVQAYLADMATELDAARLLVLRAARAKDCSDERHTKSVSMAKMYATEAAQQVIDKAVQLFGGQGVTAGNVAERLYREIRPLRIYEGTTEIQRVIIANALFKGE
ncbi:MAG TPA: acyl-CoA dehydrogenase, partial [Myxococcales bacterium]|nr:acyl-CoA dehydrogenase [Myxococcales bacterium]